MGPHSVFCTDQAVGAEIWIMDLTQLRRAASTPRQAGKRKSLLKGKIKSLRNQITPGKNYCWAEVIQADIENCLIYNNREIIFC